MNNEEKILQALEQIQGDIKDMKVDIESLKECQIETNKHLAILDTKVDSISNKLDDIEALNVSRHTEITSSIINLSKDFTIVEAVTGKNMADIAHLKAVK